MTVRENTTSVAQFISMATENEIRDPGLLEYADVIEVGAELENAANGLMSQFVVKTADGQEWNVRVTPKVLGGQWRGSRAYPR